MNLKKKVKEFIVQVNNEDYMVIFKQINDQDFIKNCDKGFYYIENSNLYLYLKNQENEKEFLFENLEKRTIYKLKKEKKITFIETLSETPFHYTLYRGKK